MTINKHETETELTLSLTGRLDTVSAPLLESSLEPSIEGKTSLIFDLAGLEYISSAGLRVLLSAQKRMNRQGSMTVRNACETVMEVFEITGFCDILTLE